MKILLISDVKKLGWLGDVVEVNSGYARNYLLPMRLAKEATETNIKSIAKEKNSRIEQRLRERKNLEKAAAAVEGTEVVISAKANEKGHLFGSVTGVEIAASLSEQGFEVTPDIVHISEHIKQTGESQVQLKFADDVVSTVKVVVVAEGGGHFTEEAESESVDGEKPPKE